MKKLIIILMIGMFLISIVAAAELSYIFKKDTEVDLKLPCYDENSSLCINTVDCNITVLYPNTSAIVNHGEMQWNENFFNYTIPDTMTNIEGEYSASVSCDGSYSGFSTFHFKINKSGTILSSAQGYIYIALLAFSILLFVFCFIGALKIPWRNGRDTEGKIIHINNLRYAKVFLWVMSYLLLIWIFWIAKYMGQTFLRFDFVSQLFNVLFMITLVSFFPVLTAALVFTIISFLTNKRLQKAIIRGIPLR